MRDGEMVWEGSAKGTSGEHLISLMGGVERKTAPARGESGAGAERKELVRIHNYRAGRLSIEELSLYSGEIVGVAGLEGSGQEELLRALFSASARGSSIGCYGKVAFVSGDRAREGVFQHWSIEKNISISRLVSGRILRAIDRVLESALSERWFERLRIVAQSPFVNLMRLSGGNQQKALIARAMAADADIILLNDPTRGVDIETKSELYELFREAAAAGKLLIWYSSEDDEFLQVDRTIVLSSGRLVGELDRNDFTQAKVLELSFSHIDGHGGAEQQTGRGSDARRGILRRLRSGHRTMIALLALLLTVTAMAVANPNTISETGLELLLSSAVPLVFAALAQMFVIAGSDIDLGVGTFVALTNVVTGFILSQHLVLGLAILLCGLCVYGAMGYLIHSRKMPAIVVTLGASFVWYGIALTISKIPGGSSPDWLTAVFNFTIPGVPEPLFISLLAGLAAYLILQRWRYGVVLRAFGNNPRSLHNSGWSAARARMTLYVLAGLFGTFAGLAFTAVATAADPNATGNSYTLLSVAAVVVGGGALLGGIVGPFGVVFGALTLALIGSLLGLLGVNSNLQSGVQGLLLIVILALRLLGRKRAW